MRSLLVVLTVVSALGALTPPQVYPPEHPQVYPPEDCITTFPAGPCEAAASGPFADAYALWSFNDPADLGNQDAGSCTNCDLTAVNDMTLTGGALGFAAQFDGSSYSSVADNASVSIGSNTTFGFVLFARIGIGGNDNMLSQDNTTTERAYNLLTSGSAFMFETDSTFTTAACGGKTDGDRHMYSAFYDSATGFANCKWDDDSITSDTTAPLSSVQDVNFEFTVGKSGATVSSNSIGPVLFYKGSFPDATTLTGIYNSGKGKLCADLSGDELTDLESCWDMTEDGGPFVDDIGSNDLTGVNTPTRRGGLVERSDSGMGIAGAGGASSMAADNPSSFNLTDGVGFTVAYWLGPNNAWLGHSLNGAGGNITNSFPHPSFIQCNVRDDVPSVMTAQTGNLGNSTQWSLIVCTYDPVTKKAKLSVNGAAYVSSAATGNGTYNNSGAVTLAQFPSTSGGGTRASMDNYVFWNDKTLTIEEVEELYAAGAGVFF